jgi:NAD(P)H-hydrate epimerase
MKIVSATEMREIDRATSERFGVPSITLMENAGSAVARFVLSDYPQAERVGILCGKGNNGGDGFVVARKLAEAGRAIRVVLLCDPKELRGDAATMFQNMLRTLQPLNLAPVIAHDVSRLDSTDAAEIFAADVIVDAILGTGFRPPVSPLYAAAIGKMNAASAPIIAVDIPSGSDADAMRSSGATGSPNGVRAELRDEARADAIVTFTAPRPAHVFAALVNRPGGPTVIAPIGSPPEAIVSKLGLHLSTPFDFARLLAPRARDANKGSYGHVLVIGGSLGKAGAAAMAGFAALRAGAGLSTVAAPKSVLATVAAFHPELMTEPLAETEHGTISLRAVGPGLDALLERKALAIGPGISRNSETAEFVRTIVTRGDKSIVVDADALNAFEGSAGQLNGRGRTVVITPHPGEMSRLTGLSIAEIQANRLEIARNFAREHELMVVLKGHRTLVAAPDGTVWVNPTGNPGMATGGTGDILTGLVAGLIAQHPQHALEATALAVYLHGLAGDLASESVGENSLVATDLVRFLPPAFAEMRDQKSQEIRIHA